MPNHTNENTGMDLIREDKGIEVVKSTTINRPVADVYTFWRNFENLPRFMEHLESVHVYDSKRSHWKAKAPLGTSVKWDAEILEDVPNERIVWQSLEGAQVDNIGSVHFMPAGYGTEVRVEMRYNPPAGRLGALVAKLFGESPGPQMEEDLARLKSVMETGWTASAKS